MVLAERSVLVGGGGEGAHRWPVDRSLWVGHRLCPGWVERTDGLRYKLCGELVAHEHELDWVGG